MSRRRTLLSAEVRQNSINVEDTEVIDDEAEKLQRHTEQTNSSIRINQRKQSRQVTTSVSSDINLNKSHQLPAVQLPTEPKPNNEQLSCLYNNCVKLLNENKINPKNAFQLKLIDYLGDIVLNKHIVGGDTNFQVVGCTIDAGTKIYAARVDALHQNTYQMLSGLGHEGGDENGDTGMDRQDDDGNADGANDNDEQNGRQKKLKNKRRAKKSTQLSENLEQITLKNSVNYDSIEEQSEENDIYFQTISTAIEQQAISGLLTNKLMIHNDVNMKLSINKDDLYFDINEMKADRVLDSEKLQAKSLVDYLKSKLHQQIVDIRLCDDLKTFNFLNWNLETNDNITNLCETMGNRTVTQNEEIGEDLEQHRFDKNLNELDARRFNEIEQHNSHLEFPTGANDIDVDNDDMDIDFPVGVDLNHTNPALNPIDDIRSLHSIAELTQLIGADTSEYSYFNFDKLKLHDLPKHLKAYVVRMNAASAASTQQQQQDGTQGSGVQLQQKVDRRKKEMPKLDVSVIVDRSKFFKITKKAIFLSDRTIENRLDKCYNLETERELDYNPRKLLQPYEKNIQARLITSDYDFENIDNLLVDPASVGNRLNQTVIDAQQQHHGHNDDDDDGGFDAGIGDMGGLDDNFEMAGTIPPFVTQNGGEFELLTQHPNGEHGHIGEDGMGTNMDNIVVDGDFLVKAPEQVNPLYIDYAKTAKNIDARRLKHVMWSLILSLSNDKENIDINLSVNPNDSKASAPRNINCTLKNLYNMLRPPLISQKTFEDLSVCIAFQMLLFLANEKGLKFNNSEDGSDLIITSALTINV